MDGFDTPSVLMMPHNPRYYPALLEAAGLRKAKDLLAFQNTHTVLPERLVAATEVVGRRYGVTCRRIDMKRFADEVALVKRLFNAGWERNWGYVPLTDREVDHLAAQLKPLVVPDLVAFAERQGEPIGFAAAIPDMNVALRANPSGRLFPGILRVLWAARRLHRLRVMLLGVVPEWHGRGVDALLYRHVWEKGRARGYDWAEAGWILEDNHAMVNALAHMGFEAYKTYRIYERPHLRAAVTGGTGFVGSHLVEALRARGDAVTALVRSPDRARPFARWAVALVEGALDDEAARLALVEGAEVVFHVAGLVAARSEAEFLRVNRDGSEALARTAARAGAGRLVLVSSLAVTGPSRPGAPGGRGAPDRDRSPPTVAARRRGRTPSAPPACPSPSSVHPPSTARATGPSSALFQAAARGVVPLLGDGARELTLVHAGDLARALVAAAASPATIGGTYHAGNPEPVTQRALAEAVGAGRGPRGPVRHPPRSRGPGAAGSGRGRRAGAGAGALSRRRQGERAARSRLGLHE